MYKKIDFFSFLRMLYILFVFVLLLTSCTEESKIYSISLSNPTNKAFELSDFAENITYIKLDLEWPIKHIQDFEYADSFIFVSCSPAIILKFDKNGNYITKIGSQGRGPGEYIRSLSFTIDPVNNFVIVLSDSFTLKFFDFSGKFIKTINLKNISDFSKVEYLDRNRLLLACGNPYGKAKYNWVIVDLNGDVIKLKENEITFDLSVNVGLIPSNIINKFQNSFFYNEIFNDTIFKITENNYIPAYIFLRDKYRMTPERFVVEAPLWFNKENPTKLNKKRFYQLLNFFITDQYLWIQYSLDYNSELAVLDKNTHELFEISNSGELEGIRNDLDGGSFFSPNEYFENEGEEFLVSWIDAYELKKHVFSEDFKNSTPKYPEKKKELEQLANSLDENDNPVLMLVKLKE